MKKFFHSQFFLLILQGLKSVLKFKVQFVIIAIMSFFASMAISTSVSTSHKFYNEYNSVINKINKPQYTWNLELGQKDGTYQTSNIFVLNDFINTQNLEFGKDLENKNADTSYYNVNLSSFDSKYTQYQETFLTKAFSDSSFKKTDFLNDYIAWGLQNKKFNYIDADNKNLTYNYSPSAFKSTSLYSNTTNDYIKNYKNVKIINDIDRLIRKYLVQDLSDMIKNNNFNYLKTSLIGQLFLNNPSLDLNSLVKENNYDYISNYLNNTNESLNSLISSYIDLISIKLFYQIDFNIGIILKEEIKEAIHSYVNDETINKKSTTFVKWFNSLSNNEYFYKIPIKLYDHDSKINPYNNNKELSESLADNLYALVFGKERSDNNYLNNYISNYLVGQWKKPYNEKIDSNELNTSLYTLLDTSYISSNIYYVDKNSYLILNNGFRGTLNEVFANKNNNEIIGISQMQDLSYIEGYNKENGLNYSLMNKNHTTNACAFKNLSGKNDEINSVFFNRQKLLAASQNFNYSSRVEFYYSDLETEINYRIIDLDSDVQNYLTLINGTLPATNQDILVNSGFAAKNHLKIGDYLNIGDTIFTISGIATDPFAFYSITDMSVPLPNIKKGAVVYINSAGIDQLGQDSINSYISCYYYGFYDYQNKNNNSFIIDDKYNLMRAYQLSNLNTLSSNINYINAKLNTPNRALGSESNYDSYQNFADTVFNLNYKIPKNVNLWFSSAAIGLSIIAMLVCISVIFISINKMIKLNASQIGILKALGERPFKIALSYISYGIFVTILFIPIGIIAGGFICIPIHNIFTSYFNGSRNSIYYSPIVFWVCFGVFGLFSILFSYFSAYFLTRRAPIEIMSNVEEKKQSKSWFIDKIKDTIFKKSKFTTRFSLSIASVSVKKNILMAVILLITGFLISITMMIPIAGDKIISSYYKAIRYKNDAQIYSLPGNAPLTNDSIETWKGENAYSSKAANGAFGNSYKSYWNSINDMGGNSDTSVIPKFYYNTNTNNWQWMFENFKNAATDNKSILNFMGSIFGNNFTFANGKSFNINEILKLFEYIIHSGGSDYANVKQKQIEITKLISIMNKGLPQILKSIFDNSASLDSSYWKDQIIATISAQAPPYIKKYLLKTEAREDLYSFGYSYYRYNDKNDTMYTKVNFIAPNLNSKISSLLGMSSDQKDFTYMKQLYNGDYYNFSLTGKNQKALEDLQNLFKSSGKESSDIKILGTNGKTFLLYDALTKTLNIPMEANYQVSKLIKNKKINNIIPTSDRLLLRYDGKYIDMPTASWLYDDTDYYSLSGSNHENSNYLDVPDNIHKWIELNNIESSKLTLARQYKFKNTNSYINDPTPSNEEGLKTNSYGFLYNDGKKAYIRPYYQYDNVYIIVPKSIGLSLINNDNTSKKNNKKDDWNGDINIDQVPEETKAEWSARGYNDSEYMYIRPYSYDYDKRFDPSIDSNVEGGQLQFLLTGYGTFYNQAVNKKIMIVDSNVVLDPSTLTNGKVKEINLVQTGLIKSYGSPTIMIDQGIANLIGGYNDSVYYPTNYVYEKSKTGSYIINGSTFNTYNYYLPSDEAKLQTNSKPIYKWFNGVSTLSDEPTYITTQISFVRTEKSGAYILGQNGNYDLPGVLKIDESKITLLSQEKALMNQIALTTILIGIIFITCIIVIASLSIISICDLYVNQFKKFMIIMKALGYPNYKILKYTLMYVSILSLFSYIIGIVVSVITIWAIIDFISLKIMVIPFGITWWSLAATLLIFFVFYSLGIYISAKKIAHELPSKAFSDNT